MIKNSKNQSLTLSQQKSQVMSFLKKNCTGTLAMTDSSNNPVTWVIYYVVDNALNILFTIKADNRTTPNLETGKPVQLAVYDISPAITVKVTGKPVKVTDLHESQLAFTTTLKSYMKEKSDHSTLEPGHYDVFKIKPAKIDVSLPFLTKDAKEIESEPIRSYVLKMA